MQWQFDRHWFTRFTSVWLSSSTQITYFFLLGHKEINCTQLAWTGQKLLKKMTAKYDDIFGTYEHSWVGRKWFFLKLCLATRGRCNHFSQNWNFELKIFLDIHFMTKIGSMGLWIYCLSKNESKWPKDHTCNIFRPSSKILKWAKFLKFEAFKHCGSNF